MLSLYVKYLNFRNNFKNYLTETEEGQGLVEYVLIIVLIALLVITAMNPVTQALQAAFTKIATTITN